MIEQQSLHQPMSVPPARAAQQKLPGGSGIHILDRLAVLHRHRKIGLAVFVLTSLAIMVPGYTNLRFQAQGRLLIEGERPAALSFQSSEQYDEDAQANGDSQAKIIKGRDLARRVVRMLHVETYPEFNGAADTARTPARSAGRPRAPDRRLDPVRADGGRTAGRGSGAGRREPDRQVYRSRRRQAVPGSRMVDVTFNSVDPRFAALAVNTLMEEYVTQNLAAAIAAPQTTLDKALRGAGASRANTVRIIDRAQLPGRPLSPADWRSWLVSLAIGLAAAIAVAFGVDATNGAIKTPEDIDERLRLPVMGLVPSIRGDKHPLLTSSHVPNDFGDSFRALRTSLLSRYPDPGTKLLVVTSAQPLEGKTIVAANMAMALAYGGARVLLVDADLRRPGLHRPLHLPNELGLAQVLNGQARVRDVIQRTVDPNLLAITAGRTPPNPSELLSSERMKTLLANLVHGAFDWIVIDTPPVLAVTDAVALAPSVAGIVYVIGAAMTRRRLAERALAAILSAHPRSVFAVLNKVDFSRNKYDKARSHRHQSTNP